MAGRIKFVLPDVKGQSEIIWEDKVAGGALRFSLIFWVMCLGLLGWWYRQIPPEVPLFYSRPWGEAQLAKPWSLWILPGLTLLTIIVNGMIGAQVFEKNKLLSRMLMITAAIVGFMSTYGLIRILLLVI